MNQSNFEKLDMFTSLMLTLPEEKQAAVKIVLEENASYSEISEKLHKVSADRGMQAINDGYATLKINKKGKAVLTFKSEGNCRFEELALILVSTLQVKSCNLPILRCGEKEIKIFYRGRDNRGRFI